MHVMSMHTYLHVCVYNTHTYMTVKKIIFKMKVNFFVVKSYTSLLNSLQTDVLFLLSCMGLGLHTDIVMQVHF